MLTFLSNLNNIYIFNFLYLLVGFDKIVLQICGNNMGLGSWESIQGPIVGHQAQLLISFGVISLLPMEYYDPSTFLGNWALVVMYFCYGFLYLQ